MVARAVLAGALWAVSIAVASAQERLELAAGRGNGLVIADVDISPGGFGTMRSVTPIPPQDIMIVSQPVALAGARYLAWVNWGLSGATPRFVTGFDRRTRQAFQVSEFPSEITRIYPDPIRPRLFYADWAVVKLFDAETFTTRTVYEGATVFDYAAEVDRLLVARSRAGGATGVVVDVATATELSSFPLEQFANSVRVTRDGRWFLVYGSPIGAPPFAPQYFALYDVATGQALARSASMTVGYTLMLDERRNIVLAPLIEEGRIAVLDLSTLATLGAVTVDGPPRNDANTIRRQFTPLAGRGSTGAYVVRSDERLSPLRCERLDLDVYDAQGRRRQTLDLLRTLDLSGCHNFPVLLRSPFEPTDLSAQVADHRVALTWRNPGDVTDFEIEAGLAPGQTGLRWRVGRNTTQTFDAVPPGVYFVRVRAFNEVGSSLASNEVRVEVR